MKKNILNITAITIFYAFLTTCLLAQTKQTVGWVEKVMVSSKSLKDALQVQAKLDTGADSSSINAHNLVEFQKDGKDWVRFTLDNYLGKSIVFEQEVTSFTRIKRLHAKSQKRMRIRLGICLGRNYMESEVSLVDRSKFDYQMLVGRNFLAGNTVVDPAQMFTTEPECKALEKKVTNP